MASTSPNRGFPLPTVGGDTGVWGTELNSGISILDNILAQQVTLQSSAGLTVTLSSSQAQSQSIQLNNTSSTFMTLNLNSSNFAIGMYRINNTSSANQAALITAGSTVGGQTFTLQANQSQLLYSDGVNIKLASTQFGPTTQAFGGGSSGTFSASSTGVTRIKVTLCGAGGGGGSNDTNNGSSGGTASFAAWNARGGAGGSANGGPGGLGGTGGSSAGNGVLVMRSAGAPGQGGETANGVTGVFPQGGCGGGSALGGGGGGGSGNNPPISATGGFGGGGGGAGGGSGGDSGGGGGGGETVIFWITIVGTPPYVVPAGGAAGTGSINGAQGGPGYLVVEEFYD